jgi:hypothetical protein
MRFPPSTWVLIHLGPHPLGSSFTWVPVHHHHIIYAVSCPPLSRSATPPPSPVSVTVCCVTTPPNTASVWSRYLQSQSWLVTWNVTQTWTLTFLLFLYDKCEFEMTILDLVPVRRSRSADQDPKGRHATSRPPFHRTMLAFDST